MSFLSSEQPPQLCQACQVEGSWHLKCMLLTQISSRVLASSLEDHLCAQWVLVQSTRIVPRLLRILVSRSFSKRHGTFGKKERLPIQSYWEGSQSISLLEPKTPTDSQEFWLRPKISMKDLEPTLSLSIMSLQFTLSQLISISTKLSATNLKNHGSVTAIMMAQEQCSRKSFQTRETNLSKSQRWVGKCMETSYSSTNISMSMETCLRLNLQTLHKLDTSMSLTTARITTVDAEFICLFTAANKALNSSEPTTSPKQDTCSMPLQMTSLCYSHKRNQMSKM